MVSHNLSRLAYILFLSSLLIAVFSFGCITTYQPSANPAVKSSNPLDGLDIDINVTYPSSGANTTPNGSPHSETKSAIPDGSGILAPQIISDPALWPIKSVSPASGRVPVLVIFSDWHAADTPRPSKDAVENAIFGPDPSVRGYFYNESGGRFTIEKAGVVGWYDATHDFPFYDSSDPNDSNGDGWSSNWMERWVEGIRKADREFDFSVYDTNRDGKLQPSELTVLFITPANNPGGAVRYIVGSEYPREPLIVDGVEIYIIADAGQGVNAVNVGIPAHELSHVLLDTPDMYFNYYFPYAAGAYSIMDQTWGSAHLDPYHKFKAGWLRPGFVSSVPSSDGVYSLKAVEDTNNAIIIYAPNRSNKEYFLIENRQPSQYYDSNLPDSGIGVWRINTDGSVTSTLAAPASVRAEDWASVDPNDFARRGIWMMRPWYGPPFDDSRALWEAADMPSDGKSVVFNWTDGSFAFSMTNVSSSGREMNLTLGFERS